MNLFCVRMKDEVYISSNIKITHLSFIRTDLGEWDDEAQDVGYWSFDDDVECDEVCYDGFERLTGQKMEQYEYCEINVEVVK